ncbi:TPA: DUF4435 domain-containing protein [Streptococcus suis]|nr:DUF4435 domain-containing protein [Streptococcus suis]
MDRVTIKTHQKSLQEPSVIWSEYIEDIKKNPDGYFIFYEGKDRFYYDCRIREYITNFFTYDAGGKSKVIAVHKKIESEEGEEALVRKLFFIDKDYERNEELGYSPDFFVTPKYSIENHYVTHEVMERILQTHFGLNTTKSEYAMIMKYFDERYREFIEQLTILNIWAIACKLESFKIDFGLLSLKKNPSKLMDVNYRNITVKEKLDFLYFEENYGTALKCAKDNEEKYEFDYLSYLDKQATIKDTFYDVKGYYECNIERYFRGKFIIWFLVEFISSLTKKSGGIIQNEFLVDHKNVMSVFSSYAETPEELRDYLTKKLA